MPLVALSSLRSSSRRSSSRSVLVLLAALLTLAGLAGPAAAHDALTGSTPADGESVATPPASVDLVFTDVPLAIGTQIEVTGPDGQVVSEGDPQVVDTTVSQPLAADLPAGEYSVAWRVTSGDGHPISGALTFTAAGGTAPAEPAPTVTTTPAPAASPEPGPSPSEAVAEDAPADVLPDADADAGPEASSGGVAPWVIGVAIALVIGAVAAWAVRRRPDAADRR
ncbi:copper resistance protein CopC [uncultured Cellulomonas sp.]|uniref:copper resistance CopC family protein n=1 Tax=uncultured Cellulomonas sp. TaxID=189682 RepID=UPI00262E28B2|nr:copper resistance protein CopC [uncultured Cellulomonas sp.]